MSLVFTHQDDTPLTAINLTAERGIPSEIVDLKIKNTGAQDVVGAFVTMYAEDPPGSAKFVSAGQPAVDERMGRFQITGQDSSATPGQEIVLGVVQPLGHLAIALLPVIRPGDWILANFWIEQAGSSAGGGAENIKLEIANNRLAYPLPIGVSKVGTGIDSGRKQPRSFLIIGRHTTATGTPDDQVHVEAGDWLIQGEEYSDPSIEDVTFDQLDGLGAALASGEAYIAVITQGFDLPPNVTKGIKNATPDRPTPPAGELILSWVTVFFRSGGTSVLNTADIEEDMTFGRYRVGAPPTGLSVIVETGEAIIADFAQVRPEKGFILLPASATSRIWLEWNGAINVSSSDVPPSAGAVKLAVVVTDASNVTSIIDTRTYIASLDPGSVNVREADASPDVLSASALVFPNGSLTDLGAGVVQVNFGAGAGITVQEQDGTPTVSGVTTIKVTNSRLTDNGSGVVSLDLAGAAGLTVQEQDGTPTVANVNTIKVTNAKLTDNGSGVVSLDLAGAAPTSLTVQEQDGTPTVTGVNTIKVTNAKLTDNGSGVVSLDLAGTAPTPLTVQEVDGSPLVSNVNTIKVTNSRLTDLGSGVVSIDVSGIGAPTGLTVQEQDGTPLVTDVSTIKVTNGKMTDDGGGVISLDLAGPSAGIPVQADAFGSRPGGAEGDLYFSTDSPGIYSIKGPTDWADFFNGVPVTLIDSSAFAWANQGSATETQMGAVLDFIGTMQSGGNVVRREESLGGTTFTATFGFRIADAFQFTGNHAGIFIRDSTTGPIVQIGLFLDKPTTSAYYSTNTGTVTPFTIVGGQSIAVPVSGLYFIRLVGDGTNLRGYYSTDGAITWKLYTTVSFATLTGIGVITPDTVGYFIRSQGSSGSTPAPPPRILPVHFTSV